MNNEINAELLKLWKKEHKAGEAVAPEFFDDLPEQFTRILFIGLNPKFDDTEISKRETDTKFLYEWMGANDAYIRQVIKYDQAAFVNEAKEIEVVPVPVEPIVEPVVEPKPEDPPVEPVEPTEGEKIDTGLDAPLEP